MTTLVALLSEEARADRPGRGVVLTRLLEVLLIEAFRATTGPNVAPGLLRRLADEKLAAALRRLHGEPTRSWTVGELAREATLSRSTYFDRFCHEVGISPMGYLSGWCMAIAKDLLRGKGVSVSEVAQRVGYSSSSTFRALQACTDSLVLIRRCCWSSEDDDDGTPVAGPTQAPRPGC